MGIDSNSIPLHCHELPHIFSTYASSLQANVTRYITNVQFTRESQELPFLLIAHCHFLPLASCSANKDILFFETKIQLKISLFHYYFSFIDSKDPLHASDIEQRLWYIHPGFKTQNREYQWLLKTVTLSLRIFF